MRKALVLLALAAVAAAEDELYETVWIVGKDGNVLGWPRPEGGENADQSLKPVPVFDLSPFDLLGRTYVKMALALVPGHLDIASLCDIDRHLKKTGYPLFDETVFGYVWSVEPGGPLPETDPLLRRGRLDSLLMIRLAERRGLLDVLDGLDRIDRSELDDPIKRLAAREAAAELRGGKPPAIELPPLDQVPADADVLVVVDQRRIPPWREIWRLVTTNRVREARQTIARLGIAFTPSDLCFGQWILDQECEGFYEFARRFGNARIHRTLLALRFDGETPALASLGVFLRCEGIFDSDRLREGLAALGLSPTQHDGAVSARVKDVDVTESPALFTASRQYPVPAGGGGIPPDLAKLGLGGDDAIWIHCRKVPFADRLPVKGLQSLTLRASFDGGVTVRCDAAFKDAEAAKAAVARFEEWKGMKLEPVALPEANRAAVARVNAFLGSLVARVDGAAVSVEATAEGETPESLVEGVVDLQALYPAEGD
jgi:hypothetical protein